MMTNYVLITALNKDYGENYILLLEIDLPKRARSIVEAEGNMDVRDILKMEKSLTAQRTEKVETSLTCSAILVRISVHRKWKRRSWSVVIP